LSCEYEVPPPGKIIQSYPLHVSCSSTFLIIKSTGKNIYKQKLIRKNNAKQIRVNAFIKIIDDIINYLENIPLLLYDFCPNDIIKPTNTDRYCSYWVLA
jgi:hypothetical protein